MIKTRFAPSPTGNLHIGGLRTALFAYLFAKRHGGTFFVRIEDTDQERFVEGGIENILGSLKWAGVRADEGVWLDPKGAVIQIGEHGPYIQSQRLDIYKKHIEQLIDSDKAYHCFCTKERLDELRMVQEANKQATGYDGFCRTLTPADAAQKKAAGQSSVIRMKTPREGSTSFTDLVRGTVTFENALIDDQVLIKSDGFPTYHFAVVVDDHLMETTHVIRGEEWLPSTPKHILLYEMFGWQVPHFAHLSLLVNEQKQKLSKRHGDVSVEDFKEKGYLPEAVVNFIAFLGWNPGDEREIFALEALAAEFDFTRVSKAAAVFNREKLNWYNEQYIRKMEAGELLDAVLPYLENAGLANEDRMKNQESRMWLERAMSLVKDRMVTLVDAPTLLAFLMTDELVYEADILVWKKSTREGTKNVLDSLVLYLSTIDVQAWTKENLEITVGEWIKQQGHGVGDVLWPMRVALSGSKNSPGPFDIADVLGKEKSINRLIAAFNLL